MWTNRMEETGVRSPEAQLHESSLFISIRYPYCVLRTRLSIPPQPEGKGPDTATITHDVVAITVAVPRRSRSIRVGAGDLAAVPAGERAADRHGDRRLGEPDQPVDVDEVYRQARRVFRQSLLQRMSAARLGVHGCPILASMKPSGLCGLRRCRPRGISAVLGARRRRIE